MFAYLFLAAAQAAVPAQPATAATPAENAQPAKKVECRSEYEVGSRIKQKVCRPSAEWEAIARQAQEDVRKSANSRGIAPNN